MKMEVLENLLSIPIRNGLSKPTKIRGEGVKMIGMGELFANDWIGNMSMDLVPVSEKELVNTLIEEGDLLFARQSLVLDGAGKCSIVTEASEETVFESHLIRIRINRERANPYYLYYYFKSPQGKNSVARLVEQVAAAGIRGKELVKLSVPCPEMSVQNKVADFLCEIDRKILVSSQINRNLQEILCTVYEQKFSLLDKVKTLEEYPVKIYSGGTPSTSKAEYWNGNIPWLASGETAQSFVIETEKHITKEGVDNSSTKWASKYDVVTASAGQGHTRGQTSMLLLDTCVNQSVIVTHAEKQYMPFIYCNICGRYEELRVLSDGTSTRGSLTTKMMAKLSMPDATEQDIVEFSDFAWTIVDKIEKNQHEICKLTMLRDTLLPKLMSGELDVSDLDV